MPFEDRDSEIDDILRLYIKDLGNIIDFKHASYTNYSSLRRANSG